MKGLPRKKKKGTRRISGGIEYACKYSYSGRLSEFVHAYNAVAAILFRGHPWYSYPGYLLWALHHRYLRHYKDTFRICSVPNKIYEDALTKYEVLKSEHIAFVPEEVFADFSGLGDVSFVKLIVNSTSVSSIIVQIMPAACISRGHIFVEENMYSNLRRHSKCSGYLYAKIGRLSTDEAVPQIASKAQIAVLNNHYEIPEELLEKILWNYFNTPRVLHFGHIYRVALEPELIGYASYAHYYTLISFLKHIYFKCLQVEINGSAKALFGVVTKGLTNLVQAPNAADFLPQQFLHDAAVIETYPAGLKEPYSKLYQSLKAFMPTNSKCLSSKQKIYPVFMVQGTRGSGKTKLVKSAAQALGFSIFGVDSSEIVSQVSSHTEIKLKAVFAKCQLSGPLLIYFYNFEIFGIDNEGNEDLRLLSAFSSHIKDVFSNVRKYPIIIIALTNEQIIKPMIQRLFLEIIQIDPLSEEQRYKVLRWLYVRELFQFRAFKSKKFDDYPFYRFSSNYSHMTNICNDWKLVKRELRKVAKDMPGLVLGDIRVLFDSALRINYNGKENLAGLKYSHFAKKVNQIQNLFANSIGAPKVPKVLWTDIGGLSALKEEVQISIGLPLNHVDLMGKGMRRSGILLYGPPGTGKTLVAKAVATEFQISFLSVQGPELLNMYVGQSEQNVRAIFSRANGAAPCVVFLDELDSLAPNRGVSGDSGGVMDRVVSQLLAEMDGLALCSKPVFILAATNRPDLIDPALLRPGRFDKLCYVSPCVTTEEKVAVLKAQTHRMHMIADINLNSIASRLQYDVSGADLSSICSNAWMAAVRRSIQTLKNGCHTNISSENIVVRSDDFIQSCDNFVPSISNQDLSYYNKLKLSFSN